MELVTSISLAILLVAAALCLARMLRPASLADRIVALDTLLVTSVIGIAVLAVRTETEAFTPVLLVVALVGFLGTITVAKFIERRGA